MKTFLWNCGQEIHLDGELGPIIDELLWKWLLTGSCQFNLLRHGSSQLVRSVASVFALKLGEVLVKHKSAIWPSSIVCRDMRRNKVLAIFCPPVSVREKYSVSFSNQLVCLFHRISSTSDTSCFIHSSKSVMQHVFMLSPCLLVEGVMSMSLTLAVGSPWLHT